jgi:hypothetical protein
MVAIEENLISFFPKAFIISFEAFIDLTASKGNPHDAATVP